MKSVVPIDTTNYELYVGCQDMKNTTSIEIDVERFPIFDAHTHFSQAYLDQVMACYTRCGVTAGVVIQGYNDHALSFEEFLIAMQQRDLLKRWAPCYWPNWAEFGWQPEAFVERLVGDLHRFSAMGCRALKVWKDLGMFIVHPDGFPATMDDPRLRPIWDTVAKLGLAVWVHQADPSNHFVTRTGLSREELYERRNRVIAAYPHIRFVLCHNGNDIESVAKFSAVFDRFPNTMSDINRDFLLHDSLEDTRNFITRYADRLMFGPDNTMPNNRPPDVPWSWNDLYLPWRKKIVSWGLDPETFHKFTWATGANFFSK